MKTLNLSEDPHRRFNPLTGEWILISPHRTRRPWQGHVEHAAQEEHPQYDPSCYLCPGNSRAGSAVNPHYEGAFAFDNDFSALLQTTPAERIDEEGLLVANGEPGLCRVVCFSPRHDLTLAELDVAAISGVIDMWVEEYESLGGRREINYVQIFENKGELMGCSNPHPHCQIWAQHSIPDEPAKESRQQSGYLRAHERCML